MGKFLLAPRAMFFFLRKIYIWEEGALLSEHLNFSKENFMWGFVAKSNT